MSRLTCRSSPSTSLTSHAKVDLLRDSHTDLTPMPSTAVQSGATSQLYPSEATLNAVVQVETAHSLPDLVQPWRRKSPTRSIGTAFAIDERMVLTSANNLTCATNVTLRHRSHDEPFVAAVVACDHVTDIAILTVHEDAFWDGLRPLNLVKSLPPLQERVGLLYFCDDVDNVTVSTGALQRLIMDEISDSFGTRLLGKVEIRASGEAHGAPVVDAQDRVIGMFTNVRSRLVAMPTLRRFVAEFRDTGSSGTVPYAGFEWQPCLNPSLRKSLKMQSGESGVYVRAVPDAVSKSGLRVGDVVTKLDDMPVSSKGTVRLRGDEKVALTYVTAHKRAGDVIRVEILRDGQKCSVRYRLPGYEESSIWPLRRFERTPDYVTIGGLVFTSLNEQYMIDAWGLNWPRAAPMRLLQVLENGIFDTDEPGRSDGSPSDRRSFSGFVLLTEILTSRMTVSYEHCMPGSCILTRFNGRPVPDLRGLASMLRECTDEFLVFDFDEHVVVLDRKEAFSESANILSEHGAVCAVRIGDFSGDIALFPDEGI